jgi:integral membrane sensor domain MASE1
VLGHDFSLVAGLLLGIAAFTAHALVSSIITSGMSVADRGYLALGQQNGVTAIVLALVLEPDFPGSAGVVATAIVVVNLLHAVSTAGWGRRLDARNQPAAPAEDGPATAVVREPESRESPQFT